MYQLFKKFMRHTEKYTVESQSLNINIGYLTTDANFINLSRRKLNGNQGNANYNNQVI